MPAFLLEVGTEELPASFLSDALAQWRSRIPQALSAQSLNSEAVEVYGTPRRLAVLIKGLPSQQPDREEEIKGPPAQTAFQDGKPKPAAVGFAKKQGVDVSALEIRATDKGDFVFVRKVIPGRHVAEILTELVREWIWGLEGKRLMRWGDGDARFSRPIRWLVALLDDAVLPMELVNGSETIKSDRISHGHRVLYPKTVTIPQATDYITALRSAYVVVDPDERATTIQQQIQESVQQVDGYVKIYPDLLEEVTNLVEWPTAVVGKFESEFLNLPTEVITTVMVSHQRYFPVFTAANSNELLPYFVTISNGDPAKSDIIAVGNARVIRARLADGQFFYKADLAKPLESFLPQLAKVTFQEDLGSLLDKVGRIEENTCLIMVQLIRPLIRPLIAQLKEHSTSHELMEIFKKAPRVAELLNNHESMEIVAIASRVAELLNNHELMEIFEKAPRVAELLDNLKPMKLVATAPLAAKLCKADLVTQMVYEFPELQGVMGQKYALASKEAEVVATATAIFEHYLPRGANDKSPETLEGQVVGLADRLDTLVSIFSLGMIPTGSSDPFALRRAANAVINVTWRAKLRINLQQLLEEIIKDDKQLFEQNLRDNAQLPVALQEFFLQRIRTLLQEEYQIDYDLVNAVLGENDPEYAERALKDLLDVRDRALFLQEIRRDGTLEKIYETVNRSTRLAAQGDLDTKQLKPQSVIRKELFQKPSEAAFYNVLVDLVPQTVAAQESRNYRQLVTALVENTPTVSNFFDGPESVLVMDSDPEIRRNRLNLLGLLRNHARILGDFGAIIKNL